MALSDYERRVLEQIESELTALRAPRLARVRSALRSLRWTILILVVAIGGVVAASFTAGWLAAPIGALSGVLAGFAVSSRLLRRRGPSAAPR
jgi:uncharacterized membrane protein (DUF485 family)